MQFGSGSKVPTISAEDRDRLTARYAPLAAAVRDLIDASLRTEADGAVVDDACAQVRAVTEALRAGGLSDAPGMRYVTGEPPTPWGNTVVGLRNPIAPPLAIRRDDDGRYRTDFHLGAPYEGPPGLVHGGVSALVLDHLLGEAASDGMTRPLYTGTITVKYLRGTPLGALRGEAWTHHREGVKTIARGHLCDAQGVTVEAEGVFILPAWARDPAPAGER
ncbi:PaaI family thioesterase [Mycobacterium sp. M1]|uniref:PaaI family thioesterase n=1 Tax=Mycolicibacter acidiphilus TaxID=2835306 RepID=A0ABS5RJE7_9MYCO|nr:PaaI family thioesterase [Mycolicibacter acidiphilus]MBS9533601.1 PaaI family thioesterase [Mycolicibacter acidiphilus]